MHKYHNFDDHPYNQSYKAFWPNLPQYFCLSQKDKGFNEYQRILRKHLRSKLLDFVLQVYAEICFIRLTWVQCFTALIYKFS